MITIDGTQLDRARSVLAGIDNGFAKAVAYALNRSSEAFATDAVRGTTGRYHVQASEVRKALSFKAANKTTLTATIIGRGRRKSIAGYKLVPSAPTPGRQLMGAVKRNGLKPLPRAFFVRGRPFFRKSGELVPIISPSVPQIVKNDDIVKHAEQEVAERFAKRLDHEIFRLLGAFRR